MPLTATAAKGIVGVMVEAAPGEQSIMPATTLIATMSAGIVQPTGSTGMRMHLLLTGWTAGGTITITGTGTPNNTETWTVAAPTTQQQQSLQVVDVEYVSVNAYTAITNFTASAPIVAGGGTLVVKGIQAAKFNIPVTAFHSGRKTPMYSPNEHTGLMTRDKRLIQTINNATIDSWTSDLYGDISLYWPYLLMGAPATTVTLPAAPLSIVAAATIIASMTIANQPTAPGMKLILTVTTFTGSPSVTITGTSYGIAGVTETITPTANGTYYSANVYSALTSIGGTINSTTVAVTGVFGWKMTFNEESNRSTLAIEHFDGSGSWIHPFVMSTDGDFTLTAKGSQAMLTIKAIAQDKLPIGDRTTNPLQVSRMASLGIPLQDIPIAAWQTNVYLDPITGTAGTTLWLDVDDLKIVLKTPSEAHFTFNNSQNFTRAYPIKPECTADLTLDIINLLQFEQFRQNLKQYLVVAMVGEYIGTTGGTNYSKGWTWTLPGRFDGLYEPEGDPAKGNTFAKPKWRTEYDASIGAAYQLAVVTRNPPSYAT